MINIKGYSIDSKMEEKVNNEYGFSLKKVKEDNIKNYFKPKNSVNSQTIKGKG